MAGSTGMSFKGAINVMANHICQRYGCELIRVEDRDYGHLVEVVIGLADKRYSFSISRKDFSRPSQQILDVLEQRITSACMRLRIDDIAVDSRQYHKDGLDEHKQAIEDAVAILKGEV